MGLANLNACLNVYRDQNIIYTNYTMIIRLRHSYDTRNEMMSMNGFCCLCCVQRGRRKYSEQTWCFDIVCEKIIKGISPHKVFIIALGSLCFSLFMPFIEQRIWKEVNFCLRFLHKGGEKCGEEFCAKNETLWDETEVGIHLKLSYVSIQSFAIKCAPTKR